MKISLSWLQDYVKIKASPEKIAAELTLKTCAVENILDERKQLEGLVVAKVLTVEKHPNADKLSLVLVDFGKGKTKVVCGAPNVAVGRSVVLAALGSVLPNGLEIKKAKIRGVESAGMLCAEDELGLSKDHSKILVLDPKKARVGMSFADYLGKDDVVFEIENKSISHRPDLFSHFGMAREAAAIFGMKITKAKDAPIKFSSNDKLTVKVEAKKLCPRYLGVVLSDLKIKPAPEFMQKRLYSVGVRPINNVVDITNYVMLELGNPLHAFDAAKLSGKKIVIRLAKKGEKIKTIDNVERELQPTDLIIADAEKPIAIAGVMGGLASEVTDGTKRIILEAANFDPSVVRKTSWRLGLRSEAVTRFEKNLTPALAEVAMKRAVNLLVKYAGAKVTSKIIDIYPVKEEKLKLELDPKYCQELLGLKISKIQIKNILTKLGFKVSGLREKFIVVVPSCRRDVKITEDLIEEVGRFYGAYSIPAEPFMAEVKPVVKDPVLKLSRELKAILSGLGLDELVTYSFYGKREVEASGYKPEDHLTIVNPLSPELKYLRRGLLPQLLSKMALNLPNFEKPVFYEVGHLYSLEKEKISFAALIFGEKEKVFFEAKGVMEVIMQKLGIKFSTEAVKLNQIPFEKERSLVYKAKKEAVGLVGLVSSSVLKKFGIKKGYVAAIVCDVETLDEVRQKSKAVLTLPKFPAAKIDLAFVLKNDLPLAVIEKAIREAGKPLLENIIVFDIYRGKPLDPSEKSLAFHLTYRSPERTLTDAEVLAIRKKVEARLLKDFGAKIRDF